MFLLRKARYMVPKGIKFRTTYSVHVQLFYAAKRSPPYVGFLYKPINNYLLNKPVVFT